MNELLRTCFALNTMVAGDHSHKRVKLHQFVAADEQTYEMWCRKLYRATGAGVAPQRGQAMQQAQVKRQKADQ